MKLKDDPSRGCFPELRAREQLLVVKALVPSHYIVLLSVDAVDHFRKLFDKLLKRKKIDMDKIAKSKAKLVLTIDVSLFVHMRQVETAQELREKLKSLYSDSGFTRKIGLLRSLLLAGLPKRFAPMIKAIEHSGIDINTDQLLDIQIDGAVDWVVFLSAKQTGCSSKYEKKNTRCYKSKQYDNSKNKYPTNILGCVCHRARRLEEIDKDIDHVTSFTLNDAKRIWRSLRSADHSTVNKPVKSKNVKFKTLRSDDGGEFCGEKFEKFLKANGIEHQKTNSYTPRQNGMLERMNYTIVEKARCLLLDANLEKKCWAEAVNTAVYLRTRFVVSGLNNKTPFEIWTSRKPDVCNIRIFGSEVLMHIPKEKGSKWDKKAKIDGNAITSRGRVVIEKALKKTNVVITSQCDEQVE
ncbi:hypothetical protein ILUMI_24326 [Ignelater luminosus]|uniref:Integrase catalytic domain-containing protein n=1 Tax=Ignelater luminosus TaxID=2038154 RepID=A0A8K0CAP9_IGNLU|nr:hypothetical protein ILUMI_24326 [Ignelater luminosus]